MDIAVVIPFRDRGIDPTRAKNLRRVMYHWAAGWAVRVQGDGRDGDEQFNRSAAYNMAIQSLDADVYVFAESDIIVPFDQVTKAIRLAVESSGQVVPFTHLMDLDEEGSEKVRQLLLRPDSAPSTRRRPYPTVGGVNVVSRETMELVGQWDERFEGAWSDDNAMDRAFTICAGPTRFVDGEAYHLYHGHPRMPFAHPGSGTLTSSLADTDAISKNMDRWFQLYLKAETPERIRELTAGGD